MAQTMPGTVIPKPLPWLWIFLLAGTVVRIAYAVLFKPWWEAADHLAWAIVLKSVGHVAGLGYWQFIHYPQEGGSIPISLLTLLIGRIPGIAALPASALLVDAFSRWVQLKVVAARFDRKVFLLFGAWTVCGLPILITWSSVNCGLHNLSSFFPFVVLWLISRPSEVNARVWTDGLVLGLAVWFSYNCLLLLPVYLLLSRPLFQRPGPLFRSSAAFVAVLAVHFLFRTSFDPGFHLPEWSPVSVRGLHFQRPVGGMIHDMGDVWTHALPGSSLLPAFFGVGISEVRWLWAFLALIGAVGCMVAARRQTDRRPVYIGGVLLIVVFALGYAASPVAVHQVDHPSYMYYRHWAFILPMIALVAVAGLARWAVGRVVAWCFVLLSSMGTVAMFREEPSRESKILDTGFVLALKLGHDPARLGKVIENVPDLAHELFIGAGWGTTEELLVFNQPTSRDTEHLIALINAYPPTQRTLMIAGVEMAFARQGTDRISTTTRKMVREALRRPQGLYPCALVIPARTCGDRCGPPRSSASPGACSAPRVRVPSGPCR